MPAPVISYPWMPDCGDGRYRNPVICADYSDPDVVEWRGRFYMVSSSFAHTPAIPVLESPDLVNWTIIAHVAENLPSPLFDRVQHGKGVWAPSIRLHKGFFYVYYGDPDLGIFMSKSNNPKGPWTAPLLVKKAKGWIDPCPLWDADGKAYLVHAWAKSRAGFNSILSLCRMNEEGTKILDEGRDIFDGHAHHPTIEGPKFYRRNGWYYIFAPAGGVKPGWQTVLRSRSIDGPYEDRIVMDQGSTVINGPHQGAWVTTRSGEDWFIHFQDRGAYGRIVHLQPMRWKDDWPVIGRTQEGTEKGEPVAIDTKPDVKAPHRRMIPQTSDEFRSAALGLQWQWQANHKSAWYSLHARPGALRLYAVPKASGDSSLWMTPNLLLQKFPAERFTVKTRVDARELREGDRTGLIIFGLDYAAIDVQNVSGRLVIEKIECTNAHQSGTETRSVRLTLPTAQSIDLAVSVDTAAVCHFSVSADGRNFTPLGHPFQAREGMWVGAKVGLYCVGTANASGRGSAEYEFFRFE